MIEVTILENSAVGSTLLTDTVTYIWWFFVFFVAESAEIHCLAGKYCSIQGKHLVLLHDSALKLV
jgi:hypothetical protein